MAKRKRRTSLEDQMPEVKTFDDVVPKAQVPKPEYDIESTPRIEPDIDVKTSNEPDDMPDVAPAPKRIEPTSSTSSELDQRNQDEEPMESAPTSEEAERTKPVLDEETMDGTDDTALEPVVEEPDVRSEDTPWTPSMDVASAPRQEELAEATEDDTAQRNTTEPTLDGWIWVDVDPATNPDEPDAESVVLVQEQPDTTHVVQEVVESEDWVPTKDKVDLESFFEAPKEQRKWKRSDKKQYSKKERKRRKQRSTVRSVDAIEDQRTFLFRKKKYKEVDEFIAYLNDHYLDIDDVARDVLANEWFFGWLAKRSGVLPQSLNQFKELKRRMEENQRTK